MQYLNINARNTVLEEIVHFLFGLSPPFHYFSRKADGSTPQEIGCVLVQKRLKIAEERPTLRTVCAKS